MSSLALSCLFAIFIGIKTITIKKTFSFSIAKLLHVNFFRITSWKAEILALAGVDITKPVEITLKTKDGEVK